LSDNTQNVIEKTMPMFLYFTEVKSRLGSITEVTIHHLLERR